MMDSIRRYNIRPKPDRKTLIRIIPDDNLSPWLEDVGKEGSKLLNECPTDPHSRVSKEDFARQCRNWKQRVKRFIEKHYKCKLILLHSFGNCFNAEMYPIEDS